MLILMIVQIAVTLPEWERVAEPFANSSHYLEKSLYKVLSEEIVPFITEALRVRKIMFLFLCILTSFSD